MRSNFASIGFSQLELPHLDKIVQRIAKNPTERYVLGIDTDTTLFEYYTSVGESKLESDISYGVSIRGRVMEQPELDELKIADCLPYAYTYREIDPVFVSINKNRDNYYVIFEDKFSRNEVEFYLQNAISYLKIKDRENPYIKSLSIAGLASYATVVLPVEKRAEEKELVEEQDNHYNELLDRARDGDLEARRLLEAEEDETVEIIRERLQTEDFLTVVEGYFIPADGTHATYYLLGDIVDSTSVINQLTNECIHIITVTAMGTTLDIFVNECDLLGIPSRGMRLITSCWIQGKCSFIRAN